MCFSIFNRPEKLIADEDIVCYKTVYKQNDEFCESVCTKFIYELNRLYTDKDLDINKINDDYHELFTNEILKLEYHLGSFNIHVGYHSYIKPMDWNYTFWVECIIPKGSTYYKDDGNHYVSDQIIIKKYL